MGEIKQTLSVYADLSDREHLTVLAQDVSSTLRGPLADDGSTCVLVIPADAGEFGDELEVAVKFSDLARFVHEVEAQVSNPD